MATEIKVQFAGNAVSFNSDNSEILKSLRIHFKHCPGAEAPRVANYEVIAGADGLLSAYMDGVNLFSNSDFKTTLWQLMQDALFRLNSASSTELIFHAAALAQNSHAIILCGGSGSGKSSLAAWLTASGMSYLTDEVISMPVDGAAISGLCRSIVLKSGSAFIWQHWLKDLNTEGFLRFKENSVWIEPSLFNPDGIQAKATPHLLIFPRYVPDTQFRVEHLTPAAVLFRLLQHLVNARNFSDYGLAATARLARQVDAYTLEYSHIETASEWIQKTLQPG
jgi:hypothetical protein